MKHIIIVASILTVALAGCRMGTAPIVSTGRSSSASSVSLTKTGTASLVLTGPIALNTTLRTNCVPLSDISSPELLTGQEFLAFGSGVSVMVLNSTERVLGLQNLAQTFVTVLLAHGSGTVDSYVGVPPMSINFTDEFLTMTASGTLQQLGTKNRVRFFTTAHCI